MEEGGSEVRSRSYPISLTPLASMTAKHPSLYLYSILVFLVALSIGASVIYLKERNAELQRKESARELAAIHGHLLQQQLNRSLSATYALAAVVRQGKGKIDNFEALADEMLKIYSGTSALQLAPNGVISRTVPLRGNEAALGHNLLQDPVRNKEAFSAIRAKQLTLAGPFTLRQGGVGVVGRLPIFLPDSSGNDRFWGFATAVVKIDDLLAASNLVDEQETAAHNYELSRIHPDTGRRDVFAASVTQPLLQPVDYRIDVPNGTWTLSIAPKGGWHSSWGVLGVETAIVLLISILATTLIVIFLRRPEVLRREVELRTQELRLANERLQAEIKEREIAELALRESESRLETRVAERTAELSAANKELEGFTYAASHDLKGPLGRINIFSNMLAERYRDRLEGDGLQLLEFIQSNAKRLTQLVEDLLSHARVAQQTLELQPIEIGTEVDAALQEFAEDFLECRAAVSSSNLAPAHVLADSHALHQVLQNLIQNALKFTAQTDSPTLEIGGETRGHRYFLWVRDNGIGFDMDYHDRIFELFRRLHTYSEYEGSGIGLALVKRAMERMGGRVWAESAPGQGTTFFLELQKAA